ncbi:MAG: D-sedoheptulose 7-phosphate isomerase [Candidatus Omnitrophica bacterium]|nr:D-sedoheptulose 7-phosphate isomerase [Candidatus Omnitrophota bacterium]
MSTQNAKISLKVKTILQESITVKERLKEKCYTDLISKIVDLAVECLKNKGKIMLCGNGGSAADTQHLAAEFVNRFKKERVPLPALALTTDTSIITSIANDYSYSEIFTKQILALGKKEDILIAISTSGNAENVLAAVETAKQIGIKTIALTGKDGGGLKEVADICLIVPSNDTARIQEAHITIGHIICETVEEEVV